MISHVSFTTILLNWILFLIQVSAFWDHMSRAATKKFNDNIERYQLRGDTNWLVVGSMGTFIKSGHCYNNFDCCYSYCRYLKLSFFIYWEFLTRFIIRIVRVIRTNGKYISVSEKSTRWLDQRVWIQEASLLPSILSLRNATLKDMK
jgi:hypothetical protein